jgi:hypothetical protein
VKRAAAFSIVVFALGAYAGAADVPPLPACATVDAATIGVIDSGLAKAGDVFRFRTLSDTPAAATRPAVPKDSVGYGVVMIAHHGASGGRPGFLVVDARFVRLADGTHVPVEIVPEPTRDTPYMQGRTANAPGFFGIIPFAGYMTGAYNTLHHGREIVVPDGTRLTLIVGDDIELGACRLPTAPVATPTPGATARPAPTSTPATTPSPRTTPTR